MLGSIVGILIYMVFEFFIGKYDNFVDVYVFGIFFWYICLGFVKFFEVFERCVSKDYFWNNVWRGKSYKYYFVLIFLVSVD